MSQGKFLRVNVPGDGDCFFHSIAGYMFIDKHHNLKNISNSELHKMAKDYVFDVIFVKNLRKQVVSWLKKNINRKLPNGLTIKDEIIDNQMSVKKYLDNMSKLGTYAGQLEITATAYLLDRNIQVWILKNGKYQTIPLGYEINKSKKYIHLFHNFRSGLPDGIHHFEILYPKPSLKQKSKSKKALVKKSAKKSVKKQNKGKQKSLIKMRIKQSDKNKTKVQKRRNKRTTRK